MWTAWPAPSARFFYPHSANRKAAPPLTSRTAVRGSVIWRRRNTVRCSSAGTAARLVFYAERMLRPATPAPLSPASRASRTVCHRSRSLLTFGRQMSNPNENTPAPAAPSDFIRDIVAAHVSEHKYPRIHTRFPPEPNGYLHIGHAKSICLNFGIAREFGGICNLRMDDTNPTKEDIEYVESIQADVNWLIGGWAEDRLGLKPAGMTPEAIAGNGERDFYIPPVFGTSEAERKNSAAKLEPFYASDYFDQIYDYAEQLIEKGNAVVCDMTPDQTDEYRRNGNASPFRDRSVEENLNLFQRMKNGEFPDGKCVLRAKIEVDGAKIC